MVVALGLWSFSYSFENRYFVGFGERHSTGFLRVYMVDHSVQMSRVLIDNLIIDTPAHLCDICESIFP